MKRLVDLYMIMFNQQEETSHAVSPLEIRNNIDK